MNARARVWLPVAARIGAAAFAAALGLMLAAQFARVAHRNFVYVQELHAVQNDIAALERTRDRQQHEIARLSDPRGAIPEIHDRLHLVGDHEAIIYLKRHDQPDEAQ